MTASASVWQHHINYTIWANRRLLDAIGALEPDQLKRDFGSADKSVAGTLTHIFRAERIWLVRLAGEASCAAVDPPQVDGFASVVEQWPALHQAWKQWVYGLTDQDSERLVSYHDLKGRPWTNSLPHIVFHVVNHSTHHRGQVSGFLRALGKTPPSLDFITFVRENSPEA